MSEEENVKRAPALSIQSGSPIAIYGHVSHPSLQSPQSSPPQSPKHPTSSHNWLSAMKMTREERAASASSSSTRLSLDLEGGDPVFAPFASLFTTWHQQASSALYMVKRMGFFVKKIGHATELWGMEVQKACSEEESRKNKYERDGLPTFAQYFTKYHRVVADIAAQQLRTATKISLAITKPLEDLYKQGKTTLSEASGNEQRLRDDINKRRLELAKDKVECLKVWEVLTGLNVQKTNYKTQLDDHPEQINKNTIKKFAELQKKEYEMTKKVFQKFDKYSAMLRAANERIDHYHAILPELVKELATFDKHARDTLQMRTNLLSTIHQESLPLAVDSWNECGCLSEAVDVNTLTTEWTTIQEARYGPAELTTSLLPYNLPCTPEVVLRNKWLDLINCEHLHVPNGDYTGECVRVTSSVSNGGDSEVMEMEEGALIRVYNKHPHPGQLGNRGGARGEWWQGRAIDKGGCQLPPLQLFQRKFVTLIKVGEEMDLVHLLQIPAGVLYFTKSLLKEYASENIDFWLEVRRFRGLDFTPTARGSVHAFVQAEKQGQRDPSHRSSSSSPFTKILDIYTRFIGPYAPEQVNISSSTKLELEKEMNRLSAASPQFARVRAAMAVTAQSATRGGSVSLSLSLPSPSGANNSNNNNGGGSSSFSGSMPNSPSPSPPTSPTSSAGNSSNPFGFFSSLGSSSSAVGGAGGGSGGGGGVGVAVGGAAGGGVGGVGGGVSEEELVNKNMFNQAQREVVVLMRKDSFHRFLSSELFRTFVQDHDRMHGVLQEDSSSS